MTGLRWVSGALLCTLGMHSIVGCGGNTSDSGGGGTPNSAGQSFGIAGAAGKDAEAGASNGGGAAGMIGGGAGANNGGMNNGGASGSAGAGCTDLVNNAPAIEETYVSGAAPAPTGGVVQDGTYFETAFVNYGATAVTPAPTHRFVARITSGRNFEAVYSDTNVSEGAEQRIAFGFETSGTEFRTMRTCLNSGVGCALCASPVFAGYDATPTTLTLHVTQSDHGGTTYTLTKR